jgi:hypothetical protein
MEKMLVTQGLNELKTLDARISRAIANAKFVDAAKTAETKVSPAKTKEDFEKDAKASLSSINALITRREKIKAAIVQSNAKTQVEVCGKEYSVAQLIDLKNSIVYQKDLLRTMKQQADKAESTMNRQNAAVEEKIDTLVAQAFGKESKTSIKENDYNSIAKPYRENNEYSLVDPVDIRGQIKELEEFIEEFEATVDAKLQVSNCVTFIEFEQ